MKIKQFIVTYNNKFQINACLESMFDNLSVDEQKILEVYVINNHTNFELLPHLVDKVKVFHNTIRPDFSTGHLSRNWNQALIHGFHNLKSPACDIVITNQDDTRFVKNYISMVTSMHRQYDLLQFGWGDNYVSYNVDAVKYIGLWDERFCSIGYQEADYFLRAWLYHGLKSSIQDESHRRILNPVNECPIDIIPTGNKRGEVYHREASKYHFYNKNFFIKKWGFSPDNHWVQSMAVDIKHPLIDSYVFYPYFEKDILTLHHQKYFV